MWEDTPYPFGVVWIIVLVSIVLLTLIVCGVITTMCLKIREQNRRLRMKNKKYRKALSNLVVETKKLVQKVKTLRQRDPSCRSDSECHSKKSHYAWGKHDSRSRPSRQVKANENCDRRMYNMIQPPPVSPTESYDQPLTIQLTGANSLDSVTPVARPMGQVLINPVTHDEFRHYMISVVDFLVDYKKNSRNFDVRSAQPHRTVLQKLQFAGPEWPESFVEILKDFKTMILPGLTHCHHPRNHAYFAAGRSYPDALAEGIVAGIGTIGYSYDSCPPIVELEVGMVNWVGRAIGLPESFLWRDDIPISRGGGTITNSSAEAIFSSILASRDWKINKTVHKRGLFVPDSAQESSDHLSKNEELIHDIASRLVVYTSKEAHPSVFKACRMAMVRLHVIEPQANNDYGITGEQLEKAIQKDVEEGLLPAHIHITLGTIQTGSFDHLESIGLVARRYNMWLHIDASWAGTAWVDTKYRNVCKGIEHAMSINVNLSKFMRLSSSISMLWTQDQHTIRDPFNGTHMWLPVAEKNMNNKMQWNITSPRTMHSLKVWVVMRSFGIEGLRRHVNKMIDASIYMEFLFRTNANVMMFGERNLTLFCFQYTESQMKLEERNRATSELYQLMDGTKELYVSPGKLDGHEFIRVNISYEETTKEIVKENYAVFEDLIVKYKKRREMKLIEGVAPTPVQTLADRHIRILGHPPPSADRLDKKSEECPIEVDGPIPVTMDPFLDYPKSYRGTTHPKVDNRQEINVKLAGSREVNNIELLKNGQATGSLNTEGSLNSSLKQTIPSDALPTAGNLADTSASPPVATEAPPSSGPQQTPTDSAAPKVEELKSKTGRERPSQHD